LRAGCLIALATTQTSTEFVVGSIAASALGRGAILVMMFGLGPIPERPSLSKDIAEQLTGLEVSWGLFGLWVMVGPAVWLMPLRVLVGFLVLLGITTWWTQQVRQRIGGVTGDCLGTACYLGQCSSLLVFAAMR
jgi:cobalamin synthase